MLPVIEGQGVDVYTYRLEVQLHSVVLRLQSTNTSFRREASGGKEDRSMHDGFSSITQTRSLALFRKVKR